MDPVFKLLRADEYAQFAADGSFAGSADDRRDGFIHLSSANQWEATRAKWFADAGGLWLVALDTARLGAALRWEASRGGAPFPHLYREIRADDVVSVVALA